MITATVLPASIGQAAQLTSVAVQLCLSNGLPPLPERFGNPVIRGWHEISAITTIDWLPQAPGWIGLAALFGMWLVQQLWRRGRQWLRNRYRREALKRLRQLSGSASVASVNEILKLTAIHASSREEVAALTGSRWSQWLSDRSPLPVFDRETLTLLETAPYQSPPPSLTTDMRRQASDWIRQHQDDHGPG